MSCIEELGSLLNEEIFTKEVIIVNDKGNQPIEDQSAKTTKDVSTSKSFLDSSNQDESSPYFGALFISVMYEEDGLFTTKIDAINSNFAYLCDVLPNGNTCVDNSHNMHIFHINSMHIN